MTSSFSVSSFPKTTFFKHSRQDLDRLFDQLETPKVGEMKGIYKGYLFSIIGVIALPTFLSSFLYWILSTIINPWKGKRFDENQGANYWFNKN